MDPNSILCRVFRAQFGSLFASTKNRNTNYHCESFRFIFPFLQTTNPTLEPLTTAVLTIRRKIQIKRTQIQSWRTEVQANLPIAAAVPRARRKRSIPTEFSTRHPVRTRNPDASARPKRSCPQNANPSA